MKVLFLITNSLCNIACTYCFYTTGYEQRSKYRITSKNVKLVAQRIESIGFDIAILTGGDPLHSYFKNETFRLISELKEHKLKVIVNTSGALLTEKDLDTLVTLKVDRVDVSIDSHDSKVHNAQRGRHADAVRTITGLIARGCNVATTVVVTSANAPSLLKTLSWLWSLGVQDVHIQRAFLPGEQTECNSVIQGAMRKSLPLLSTRHKKDYIELTERAFAGQVALCNAMCQMGKKYFICDATGTLLPCFHREDLILGNLLFDPIETLVWSLDHYELIKDALPSCFGRHCVSLFDNPIFWR